MRKEERQKKFFEYYSIEHKLGYASTKGISFGSF